MARVMPSKRKSKNVEPDSTQIKEDQKADAMWKRVNELQKSQLKKPAMGPKQNNSTIRPPRRPDPQKTA